MAAITLKEAAGEASQHVQVVYQTVGQSLRTRLDSWVQALATALPDTTIIAQRTVSNWIPRGHEIAVAIPQIEADQTQVNANDVSLYVWQTCTAAENAAQSGRISGPQAAAILGSFNAIWP